MAKAVLATVRRVRGRPLVCVLYGCYCVSALPHLGRLVHAFFGGESERRRRRRSLYTELLRRVGQKGELAELRVFGEGQQQITKVLQKS